MTDDERLRLIALDAEDLAVMSAYAQDAVLKISDIKWMPGEKRFVVPMNRFAWDALGTSRRKRAYQRRRAALHFARVEGIKSAGIDRADGETVLELLAVRFEPHVEPSGDVVLDFAGGPTIRLAVECIEAQLTDLGPTWSTQHVPRHVLA